MAQFNFYTDINKYARMDEPLTRGPIPRWQKKLSESSNVSLNGSQNVSLNASKSGKSANAVKTPNKLVAGSEIIKKKTPSPGRSNASKNPLGGDRFIPVRSEANFELNHYKMTQQPEELENENDSSPSRENQKKMAENLHGGDLNKIRVLSFQHKAPKPPEGHQNAMKVIYNQIRTPVSSAKTNTRYIASSPDRILDAPEIIDDYYLNLVDWGQNNILAVALNTSVYLWNAATGNIEELLSLEESDCVCSLSWVKEGDYLAVGTTEGLVQVWDCNAMKRMRIMDGHTARVGSLSWNNYILSSGSRSGYIIHHDVRQREHKVGTLLGHTQEVCGLKWSTDGRYLASGGNDNLLNIWPVVSGGLHSHHQPLNTFNDHQAAVKALAWCPWQPHLLASGGGTADRSIRFWNCNMGTSLSHVDTKSQVCALMWSSTYKEIVSGHGYANNQLIIWKYPSLAKVTELTGHTARVLHLAMSPDGTTILSAGADETLRLWKCFLPDQAKKKEVAAEVMKSNILKQCIR